MSVICKQTFTKPFTNHIAFSQPCMIYSIGMTIYISPIISKDHLWSWYIANIHAEGAWLTNRSLIDVLYSVVQMVLGLQTPLKLMSCTHSHRWCLVNKHLWYCTHSHRWCSVNKHLWYWCSVLIHPDGARFTNTSEIDKCAHSSRWCSVNKHLWNWRNVFIHPYGARFINTSEIDKCAHSSRWCSVYKHLWIDVMCSFTQMVLGLQHLWIWYTVLIHLDGARFTNTSDIDIQYSFTHMVLGLCIYNTTFESHSL